jgi:hypothetical protein
MFAALSSAYPAVSTVRSTRGSKEAISVATSDDALPRTADAI